MSLCGNFDTSQQNLISRLSSPLLALVIPLKLLAQWRRVQVTMRGRTLAAIFLALAVVVQTAAAGVFRAHDFAHAQGLQGNCERGPALGSPAPAAPEHQNRHDCFVCQQCAGGGASEWAVLAYAHRIFPLADAGRDSRTSRTVAQPDFAPNRQQLPRAPPVGA